MTGNLRHWDALSHTDPKHTKPFDRGRFKGTAVKPIYNEYRMTEVFGPCGIGWGMDKPDFQIHSASNEIVVYCTLRVWYMDGEQRGEVYGVGGDKVLAAQKNGPFVSDEAFKASFTDALGNALKHIGVSADIHMGRFDDHKYVDEMRREFANDKKQAEVEPMAARQSPPQARPPARAASPQDDPFSAPAAPPNRESAGDPKAEFIATMRRKIEAQRLPARVEEVIAANSASLAHLKEDDPISYGQLMNFADAHKNALLEAA